MNRSYAPASPGWIIACVGLLRLGAVPVPVDSQADAADLRHIAATSGARRAFTVAHLASRLALAVGDEAPAPILLDREPGRETARRDTPTRADQDENAGRGEAARAGREADRPLRLANLAGPLDPATAGAREVDAGELPAAPDPIGIPRLYAALMGAVERRIGAGGAVARWAFAGLLGLATAVRRRSGLHMGRVLFAPLRRRVAPRLRLLISGGAALDPDLAARLEGLGWIVATGYGLTETAPILTIMRPGERRFESAGRALPGVELRIGRGRGGDDGELIGDGECGEVEARGPNVFSGYLADADGGDGFTARMFGTPWMRLVSRGFRVLPVAPAKRPITSLA